MLPQLISDQDVILWNEIVGKTRKAIITAHASPDGDAIGSSLGLAGYLRRRGIEVTLVMPDRLPEFLMWMPGANDIVCFDGDAERAKAVVDNCDTVFCLDFNDFSRINELAPLVENHKSTRVMLDHHLDPKINTDFMVSCPDMSSASEIVFRLLWQLGAFDEMTRDDAINIYCGMMTDTGGFTYNSSRPEIFFIISELLTKGFDKDKIYRNVFNNYSKSRVRLTGYILYSKLHFYEGLHACYYTLTAEEMKHFDFQRGDTEGLVNMPLVVKGMRFSVALREDVEKHKIRVSLRSVDDFPCNKVAAEYFNGGGHLNASGGELECSMEEAIKVMDRAVEAYRELL